MNRQSGFEMSQVPEIELLEESIVRVWNERDADRRLLALEDLYHQDATIYEPARTVTGLGAISDVVGEVLAGMPPGFKFRVIGPTLGHHGVSVTRWEGGPPDTVIVSGSDVVRARDGKIFEHFFYFDPRE